MNQNLIRLGVFGAIAFVIYKTTPLLDLLTLLLYLLIPIAFIIAVLEAVGAGFGLVTGSGLASKIEEWGQNAQVWIETKREEVLDRAEGWDVEDAPPAT